MRPAYLHMKSDFVLIPVLVGIVLIGGACVPYQKFQDMKARAENCERNYADAQRRISSLEAEVDSLQQMILKLQEVNQELRKDTSLMGMRYRQLVAHYNEVWSSYELLKKNYAELVSRKGQEQQSLLVQLQLREQELNELRRELDQRELELRQLEQDLQAREQRIRELERLLAARDSAIQQIQRQLQEALLGFGDELNVEIRDGKIYVSMSEKLLFKSGSIVVEPDGRRALGKLAEILREHPDITILVEGHTDNVPIRTSCIRDNWDLSVLRATSVVQILTQEYGIDPTRVIPSGRGEFMPVASNETPEGRARNRRTEIILVPDLAKIMKLLEGVPAPSPPEEK